MKNANNIVNINTHYSTDKNEAPIEKSSSITESVPYSEREGRWKTMFASFGNKKSSPPDLSRLNPKNFSIHGFKTWLHKKQREKLCFEQRYILERHRSLGNDLAAAHFLVFRGGAVRFVGQNEWIKDDDSKQEEYDDKLPNKFEPLLYVEALDFSKCPIVYEGLVNIKGLLKLKWLNFQGAPHFDDWCLDRITADYHNTLEYLDISDTKVTYKGLGALYRCSKLKTLKVNGIADSKLFQLTCLMLEDINTNIKIEGVKYMNLEPSE